MMRRFGALAAVGALLLTGNQYASAGDDDTYRLGGKVGDASTTKLAWDGQDDTVLTRGFRGGFGHGGYGGVRGGFAVGFRGGVYGGFRGGYYGGFRGYNSFYRPFVSVGFNRGYYGGYGYGGYGYGYSYYPTYYAPSYYAAPLYYSQPCYTYPISGYGTGGALTYQPMIVNPAQQQQQQQLPQPYSMPMKPSDGTYPYDGGPTAPVPLPKETVPAYQPGSKIVPASDGRLVSLPNGQPKATTGGFAYPAYGEQQATTFASDRAIVTTTAAKKLN